MRPGRSGVAGALPLVTIAPDEDIIGRSPNGTGDGFVPVDCRKSDGRGVRGESVVFSSLGGVTPPLGALEAPSGFSMFGFGGGGDSVGLASSLRVLVLSLLLVMLPGAR